MATNLEGVDFSGKKSQSDFVGFFGLVLNIMIPVGFAVVIFGVKGSRWT